MRLADFIREMPKAELHLHLEGSVRPVTLLKLAEINRIQLPFSTVEEGSAWLSFRGFDDFIRAFNLTLSCLRRLEDLILVVERLGQDLSRQNVRYAEVTWTPQFHVRPERPIRAVLTALNEGRARVRRELGVELRWIPDIVRHRPQAASSVAQWAASDEARSGGVVALGLGGREAGFPPEMFEAVFARALAAGLPANPHAGEAGGEGAGAESIWGALKRLKATRIGHGVQAVNDPDLLGYLSREQIPLEVCPTSNVKLGFYSSYAMHPLKRLVASGCMVTINSDDPGLFETGLTEEYLRAVGDCGLSADEIERAALNAVRASYLPSPEKASMLSSFEREYARLRELDRPSA